MQINTKFSLGDKVWVVVPGEKKPALVVVCKLCGGDGKKYGRDGKPVHERCPDCGGEGKREYEQGYRWDAIGPFEVEDVIARIYKNGCGMVQQDEEYNISEHSIDQMSPEGLYSSQESAQAEADRRNGKPDVKKNS